MTTTRNGKIARLPRAIRQQLNLRLQDGEQAKALTVWLNTLPEVQAIMAADFDGKPIRPQNLSEWKHGGYHDWLLQQEALELALRLSEDAEELAAPSRPPLTDTLALWLTARYAAATRRVAATEGAEGWKLLREMCADLVKLRKGDHQAQRLQAEREHMEFEQAEKRKKTDDDMMEWAMQPDNRIRICEDYLPIEEKTRRMSEIFQRPMTYTAEKGFHAAPEPTTTADASTAPDPHSERYAGGSETWGGDRTSEEEPKCVREEFHHREEK